MAAVAWARQTYTMYTFQATPEPRLEVSSSVAGLKFSWIIPSTPFVLQESPDLGAPNWTDICVAPTLNYSNLHQEVTVASPTRNRFYRLAHAD